MLELKHKKEEYIDKNGVKRDYDKFYVIINEIDIQMTLSAGDKTGRALLLKYFNNEIVK